MNKIHKKVIGSKFTFKMSTDERRIPVSKSNQIQSSTLLFEDRTTALYTQWHAGQQQGLARANKLPIQRR